MQTKEKNYQFVKNTSLGIFLYFWKLWFLFISLNFTNKIYSTVGTIPDLEFKEFFEEFLKTSHLRDELLMLLGFLSFEGFPTEKYCVHVC